MNPVPSAADRACRAEALTNDTARRRARQRTRGPLQGLGHIVRFNWPFYAAAAALVLVAASAIPLLALTAPVKMMLIAATGLALFWIAGSLLASWLVYDRSTLMTGAWIPGALGLRPSTWINIHAGLDDTTPAVRALFDGARGRVFDMFDPREMTEPSIARARRLPEDAGESERVEFRHLPAATGATDAVLLLLSAHELRTHEARVALFADIHRLLAHGGRVVVAEHLRDGANFAAFGPGCLHFHSRRTWMRCFAQANFVVHKECSITPFVRVFILGASSPTGHSSGDSTPALPWWQGWAPLIVMPAAVLWLAPSAWPRWAWMWALAFAIYCGCKWLTWRRTPTSGVPWWRHAAYLCAWPGLDAGTFLAAPAPPSPAAREWIAGIGLFTCGIALLFGVARLVPVQQRLLIGWIGMIGLVLILHFGIFRLLSCGWRAFGVEARPLMRRPLASESLSEFWGRRWNSAFRDLTHRFLFRPLATRVGARPAIAGGFVFSGLMHDLVISVPAAGGYGRPTLFFALQAIAMIVERTATGRRIGLGHTRRGWLFTMLVLALPAPLLFHPPFVERIVVPFMRALGAL